MNTEKKLHYFLLLTIIIGFSSAPIIKAAAAQAKKERLARIERMYELAERLGLKQYANKTEEEMLRKELDELKALHELLKQQSS